MLGLPLSLTEPGTKLQGSSFGAQRKHLFDIWLQKYILTCCAIQLLSGNNGNNKSYPTRFLEHVSTMRPGICFSVDVWIFMVTWLGLSVTVFWPLVRDEFYHYGNQGFKTINTLPSCVSSPLILDVLIYFFYFMVFCILAIHPCSLVLIQGVLIH